MVAIQGLRDLAAADALLIASGTFPAQASMDLVEAYQKRDSLLADPPCTLPLTSIAPFDSPVALDGSTRQYLHSSPTDGGIHWQLH